MREREPDNSTTPERALQISDLPADSRPRQRLLHLGERALSPSELLALVIGTGRGEHNALWLSRAMMAHFGGLEGLIRILETELRLFKCAMVKCRRFPKSQRRFCVDGTDSVRPVYI